MSTLNHPSEGIIHFAEPHASKQGFADDNEHSFKQFIFGTKANRRFLGVALIGSIIQFTLLKLCFPFPDFISDSYDYIESATLHLNVNLWPIGYAKFIYFIHLISYSAAFLVAVQYVLLQCTLLYFFFTVNYLYHPSRLITNIIFYGLLFNPMFPYLANCVLSDALFACITVCWFTLMLWQFKQLTRTSLLFQVLFMGMAFTIRYTALYYPIVSAIALFLTPMRRPEKLAWILSPALLFIPFIWFTQSSTKAITGTAQFSVFGGWQTANNALYMYGHIQVDSSKLPPKMREFDGMVKQYYQAPAAFFNFDDFPGTFFIKHQHAPLKQYMWRHYQKEQDTSSFLAWGKVSPMYTKYAQYLISHYPWAFIRYYCWFNAKKYFIPYTGQFDIYNIGDDEVSPWAQQWFHFPNRRVSYISNTAQSWVFVGYPYLFLLLNIYFAGCIIWLFITRKFRQLQPLFQSALWLLTGFFIIHFGFSVLATPVVLRYQVVPMLFLFAFSCILLEFTDFKKLQHA